MFNSDDDADSILCYDIETATAGPKPDADKDTLKLFGYYSYKINKYGIVPYTDKEAIQKIIDKHKFLVGFNNEKYDDPILKREGISLEYKRIIDLRKIIKQRAGGMITKKGMLGNVLMKYSLDYITRFLDLVDDKTAKDEIDYNIFKKSHWTKEEVTKMREYTQRDIEITKKLFEWLDDYFVSFKDFIPKNDVDKKYYLTDTIAKFAYKAICHALSWEPIYDSGAFQNTSEEDRIAGGYVAYPAGEKFEGDIYCIDYNSLYPHIMIQCNLYNRNKKSADGWHGSDMWKVEGFYNDKILSPVGQLLKSWYYLRLKYKRNFVTGEGKVVKMFDERKGTSALDYVGKEYYRVIQDASGHIQLELSTMTEESANEYINLAKSGTDRREYTVKIIINTCFSEDTEIITENGIKLVKDCKVGERVYSINKETGCTELKEIVDTQSFEYDGEMLNFKTRNMDLLVTPDHDMITHSHNTKNIRTDKASKLLNMTGRLYPDVKPISGLDVKYYDMSVHASDSCSWSVKLYDSYSQRKNNILIYNPNNRTHRSKVGFIENIKGDWFIQGRLRDMRMPQIVDIRDLMYFIGIYIAEGCRNIIYPKKYKNGGVRGKTYRVNISQYAAKNKICCGKIEEVLTSLGIRYKQDTHGFTICSKFLYDFCGMFGDGAQNKTIPEWIFKYDYSILEYLYKGLYDGDGTRRQNRYTTNSKILRDNYIKLNMHLGHRCSYKFDKKYGQCWRIFRTKQTQNIPSNNRKEKNKTNRVVCVTVKDNHTVMVGRNGMFQWAGQCYGILNNAYYQLVYDLIAGGDCTRLGRQWTKYARKIFKESGYKVVYSDTDSWYVLDHLKDKKRILEVKQQVIDKIKETVPFPQLTFDAGIDDEIKYMFFFKGTKNDDKDTDSEMDDEDFLNKPFGLMKKNYIYVTKENKVVIKNLGIRKKNISALSKEIFWKHMVPVITGEGRVKFSAVEIENLMRKLLRENIELAYMRKEVSPLSAYAKSINGIQAQIAKAYGPGIHFLIPNKRGIGVGKKIKYCNVEEFNKYKMDISDIDFDNFWKELNYFIVKRKQPTLFEVIK